MDDVLSLIPVVTSKDARGIWRTTEQAARQVLCRVSTVGGNEFHNAGRNGINPEFVFIVNAVEYNGETLVEYRGQRYSIYRTYRVPDSGSGLQQSGMRSQYDYGPDYIKLYAERKGGSNAAHPPVTPTTPSTGGTDNAETSGT